jgi:hypothetical protein
MLVALGPLVWHASAGAAAARSPPPWPHPAAGSGVVGSAGTDLEHVMGGPGPMLDGAAKWVVTEYSGSMSVPQSPRHPQNLNDAGFSLWPGLLVGNRLLQPCLVLHREVFPGDAFFSTRGSDDMSLTHQMDGCCYTHDTPFFMGLWRLWGYAGNQSVVANRWIPAGVDHVSWAVRESSVPRHSFAGDRYDYEMEWHGLTATGLRVPRATQTVQVETTHSTDGKGSPRADAGKSYGIQIFNEVFSGLPFKSKSRFMEVAYELWDFLPSSNAYLWNLTVAVANVSGSKRVEFDVHGNPTDPCTGVYFNPLWSDGRRGRQGLSVCYPNNWEKDPGCYPLDLVVNCSGLIKQSMAKHPKWHSSAGRNIADMFTGLPQSLNRSCNLRRFTPLRTSIANETTFDECVTKCAAASWCTSFQHDWSEYSCPPLPATSLGMGWEGRCYSSQCVLLSTDQAGRRCDEQQGTLVQSSPTPQAGKVYFVAAKAFNKGVPLRLLTDDAASSMRGARMLDRRTLKDSTCGTPSAVAARVDEVRRPGPPDVCICPPGKACWATSRSNSHTCTAAVPFTEVDLEIAIGAQTSGDGSVLWLW